MEVCNFLARMQKSRSYSTVAGYRSAISSYHALANGEKVGKHPEVSELMRGVFNLRSPVRKLAPPWDLQKVLEKLRGAPFEPL